MSNTYTEFSLTLVASDIAITPAHLEEIEKFLQEQAILITKQPEWLSPHKAADFTIADCLTMEQMRHLRLIMDVSHMDVFCTRTDNRRKKLLIADMDSTIVTSETLDELAAEAGIKDKIAAITERAMRGELDFHAALKERVGLLKGLPSSALEKTLKHTEISEGADQLVKTMRNHGAFCALVSGGFTFFTEAIGAKLGFTVNHGNILDISDAKLTGTVIEPILDKDSKLGFLKKYATKLYIDISDTVAIGDGANDLPMLLAAGLGIGYHPKPLLEESLLNCIRHTDLTSVLYMQGYSDKDFQQ